MSGMPVESVGRSDGRSDQRTDGPSDRRADGPAEWLGRAHSDRLTYRTTDRPPEPVIIAESPAMRRAVELARRFAPLDLPVLLVGETGTGKEVLAQAIHRWSGRGGDLVDVDCGALATGMVVAELFGHRRGAYTTAVDSMPGLLEQAARGTLFLDELASLSAEGQAALLRVLETGEVRRVGDRAKHYVDIRLLAAVHDGLGAPGSLGGLRVDLFHRLAGTVIHLPPLRDRPEDLLPLSRHLAAAQGRSVPDSVLGLLERHHWPGNVRELRHVIARAASLSETRELGARHLAEALDLGVRRPPARMGPNGLSALSGLAPEHRRLLELCRRHAGKPDAMAAELGVSRSTLFRRLRGVGISLRRGVSTHRES